MWLFYVICVFVIFYLMDKYYPKYKNKEDVELKKKIEKLEIEEEEEEEEETQQLLEVEIYNFLFFKNYLNKVKNKHVDKESEKSLTFQLFSKYLTDKDFIRFQINEKYIQDIEQSNSLWFTKTYEDIKDDCYFEVINFDFGNELLNSSVLCQKIHSVISLVENNKIKRVFIVLFPLFGNSLTTRELLENGHATIIINGNPDIGAFQHRLLYFKELEEQCF